MKKKIKKILKSFLIFCIKKLKTFCIKTFMAKKALY